MRTPPPVRTSRSHRNALAALLRTIVGLLLAALLLDAFLLGGLFQPVHVVSESMEPVLHGPRKVWTCQHCGQSFAVELAALPAQARTVACPQCHAMQGVSDGVELPGTRVWVDRASLALRALRRWEVVVFQCPQSPRAWCVKRVVGLPGERVAIRAGTIHVDGRPLVHPPRVAIDVAALAGDVEECHLAGDEYYLLGDNAARSQDSRTWSPPGVPAGSIVGRCIHAVRLTLPRKKPLSQFLAGPIMMGSAFQLISNGNLTLVEGLTGDRIRRSIMPKQKTHKGVKKRFRVTAKGKVKHRQSGTSHRAARMSQKRKRNLRGTAVLDKEFTTQIVTVLAGNSY